MSTASPQLGEVRDWISLEHADETWLFDVTFLTSSWECIWDRGCPGIRDHPTVDDAQGCCSFGAHFGDEDDAAVVRAAAARLRPSQWEFHRPVEEAVLREASGSVTAMVDDACVFLNRPGFSGGGGCALHVGALAAGELPRTWKPEVCWQLPLRLEHHEDDNGHGVWTLRQWRRHDWGEGGDSFHWWCTEPDGAFAATTPVFERMEDEIAALIGVELHGILRDVLRARHEVPVQAPTRRGAPT